MGLQLQVARIFPAILRFSGDTSSSFDKTYSRHLRNSNVRQENRARGKHMLKEGPKDAQSQSPELKIWDTQYCSPRKAFPFFREGVCSTFMPWSPEHKSDQGFEARIEGRAFENGSAAHVVMTPVVASRTKANLAASPLEGIYANYVLSGELAVEQAGRTTVARRGDLVVYHTSLPVRLTEMGKQHYEDVAFLFPRNCFPVSDEETGRFRNIVLAQNQMIGPLSSCLSYLAENLATESKDALSSVFDACVSLLPVAAGCFERHESDEASGGPANYLLREIMDFVNQNISSAELCPHRAAEHFGISARYVHKLFAGSNTTFSAYVVAKRLEHIRSDLLSPACRSQPISNLAYRWGFNDLSSFNRAFKSRFGCNPSRFRAQFAR
jgi:AraC-like DNA-binding protein